AGGVVGDAIGVRQGADLLSDLAVPPVVDVKHIAIRRGDGVVLDPGEVGVADAVGVVDIVGHVHHVVAGGVAAGGVGFGGARVVGADPGADGTAQGASTVRVMVPLAVTVLFCRPRLSKPNVVR